MFTLCSVYVYINNCRLKTIIRGRQAADPGRVDSRQGRLQKAGQITGRADHRQAQCNQGLLNMSSPWCNKWALVGNKWYSFPTSLAGMYWKPVVLSVSQWRAISAIQKWKCVELSQKCVANCHAIPTIFIPESTFWGKYRLIVGAQLERVSQAVGCVWPELHLWMSWHHKAWCQWMVRDYRGRH